MRENVLRSWINRRRLNQAQWQQAVAAQNIENARQRGHLSDEELIATAPGFPSPHHPMEMNRRLKVAIIKLTDEIVTFRKSSDKLATRLVWLTAILVAMTGVLVALTVILAIKG